MSRKKVYKIDGKRFSTLDEFYEEVSRVIIPNTDWGKNLNAFNDILRGGFGTPENGFVIFWENSTLSKERLGYSETVRQLQNTFEKCHPTNKEYIAEELKKAKEGIGSTVFDWILEIIMIHSKGGEEEEDGVELILE